MMASSKFCKQLQSFSATTTDQHAYDSHTPCDERAFAQNDQ
jgi:hypothetical protein